MLRILRGKDPCGKMFHRLHDLNPRGQEPHSGARKSTLKVNHIVELFLLISDLILLDSFRGVIPQPWEQDRSCIFDPPTLVR